MKKLFFLLIVLTTTMIYSQNYWTSEIDINFNVQSNTKVASFVDYNGVHIVYSRNGGIRYALVNSNGGIVKYDKVIESEGAGTNYANVVAFDSYVYAVYYKNNDIKVARSTNLGDNWNNTFSYFDLINTGCNKILAYKYGDFIHIVWSEVRVSGWGYDSHYIKFVPAPTPSWSEYKNVTDNETYGGDEPDITFSPNRVHVSFIKYDFDEPKTRDRSSGTWQSSQSVPFYYLPLTTLLRKGKPIIANNWLNEIYRADYATISTEGSYVGHSYRSIGSSTWYQNQDILYTPIGKVHVVDNTANDKIHIIYYDNSAGNYLHKTITGTTISSSIATIPLYEQSSYLNSNFNDLYLLRVYNPDTPSKIKFRHYDDAPPAPQDLTVQIYTEGNDTYPKLTWSLNNEPDVYITSNAYEIWRRTQCWSQEWSAWSLIGYKNGNQTEYIDYTISGLYAESCTAEYKIRAKDYTNHYSPYSSTVSINFSKFNKVGQGTVIFEYSLSQNYPNPFNPISTINYSISSAGLVTLKVYDMLGTEVASLVDEVKEAGNYSVEFNASNLPSGIYVYKITAGDFVSTKKLILLK